MPDMPQELRPTNRRVESFSDGVFAIVILRRTWLIILIYAASIPLAFVDIRLAWACFAVVPPMLFLPIIRAETAMDREMMGGEAMERHCP